MPNKDELMRDVTNLQQKLEEAQAFTKPHWERLHKLKEDLKYVCSDLNCPNVVHKDTYVAGSYFDKGYTEYFAICSVCGFYKTLKTVSDGCYG